MEQTNEKVQTGQGSDFANIASMFKNYYEKPDEKKTKLTKEEILAKYFTPRNSVEQFRILPPLKGRDVIEFAYFHYAPVNDGKSANGKAYRKLYCPAHNSPKVPKKDLQGNILKDKDDNAIMIAAPCPLCARKQAILAKQKPLKNSEGKFLKKEEMNADQLVVKENNDKLYKQAMQFDARKYHIVRGIDRGKIKDGIKFWRFKDNYKNQGVLDKLVPALKLFFDEYKINPTDPKEGTDLYINVVDSEIHGSKRKYKDVSSITARKPSPLLTDEVVLTQWLNDKSTWRDVFKPASMTRVLTPEEYLEKVAAGTDPYYDETNKKYVFPSPLDADLQAKANEKTQSLEAKKDVIVEQASDLVGASYDNVNISNVTKEDVGNFQDNHVDLGAKYQDQEPKNQSMTDTSEDSNDSDGDDEGYDDLPF